MNQVSKLVYLGAMDIGNESTLRKLDLHPTIKVKVDYDAGLEIESE